MKTYNIYKKRDGQGFKEVSFIYADSFDEACKQFAKQMTQDNWEKSNNIQWLTSEEDGVNETGWYDFNGGSPARYEETEKYDADEAAAYLLVSEESINEGFSSWSEDVYTWEVRDCKTFEIFQDGEFYEEIDAESLEKAIEYFPSEDGFEVKEK